MPQTSKPDDTTGLWQSTGDTGVVRIVRLGPVEDPHADHDHVLTYEVGKAEDSPPLDQVVELRQAYQDETDMGYLIASWRHSDIGVAPKTQTQTLSPKQAARITDYADLSIRFLSTSR